MRTQAFSVSTEVAKPQTGVGAGADFLHEDTEKTVRFVSQEV
jgi:hypothetical protein